MSLEPWLVISNCQTVGLANSLQMLAPQLEISSADIFQYRADKEGYNARFGDYARIVIAHETQIEPGADFSRAHRVSHVPHLNFSAFHPDLAYVTGGGGAFVRGPLNEYHSALALAAYKRGLDLSQTLALFTGRVFEQCGYMDRWDGEREALVTHYRHYGLELGPALRRWARDGCFMYTNNHPKIVCLSDTARLLLEREGQDVVDPGVLPHDNLANSAAFPVYPEIGEALGVPGGYRFKMQAHYRHIGMPEFVAGCFAAYGEHDPDTLAPHASTAEGYARAAEVLR